MAIRCLTPWRLPDIAPAIFSGLILCLGLACRGETRVPELGHGASIWQFPDHSVWIAHWPDGRVFQCRIGEAVFQSGGTLAPANRITWDSIWPPDTVLGMQDSLTLESELGRFNYGPLQRPMDPRCAPPAER